MQLLIVTATQLCCTTVHSVQLSTAGGVELSSGSMVWGGVAGHVYGHWAMQCGGMSLLTWMDRLELFSGMFQTFKMTNKAFLENQNCYRAKNPNAIFTRIIVAV